MVTVEKILVCGNRWFGVRALGEDRHSLYDTFMRDAPVWPPRGQEPADVVMRRHADFQAKARAYELEAILKECPYLKHIDGMNFEDTRHGA